MNPYTPQDYTGDGAVHKLSDLLGVTRCRWWQVVGISIASATIPARVGDASVGLDVSSPLTKGRGFPVGQDTGQFAPPLSDPLANGVYNLEDWYIVVATSDKVSIGAIV